jgi:hypothetical protein
MRIEIHDEKLLPIKNLHRDNQCKMRLNSYTVY